MSKLADVLQIGTRAAQPAASAVAPGTLYSVTDESNVVEQSDGSAWSTYAGARSAGAITLIASQTLTAAAATVTFSSIPGTYKDLVIIGVARSNKSANNDDTRLQFNGDTGSNYGFYQQNRFGAGATDPADHLNLAAVTGATATANIPASFTAEINAYAQTTFHKVVRAYSVAYVTGSGFGDETVTGRWASTAAITQIDIFSPADQFVIGSTFSLYGRS